MSCFAYYRLPNAHTFVCITSERSPLILSSLDEIDNLSGYLIAPFVITPETPLVCIRPDSVEERPFTSGTPSSVQTEMSQYSQPSASYVSDFGTFHNAILQGTFRKLVLARQYQVAARVDAEALFKHALQQYPDGMVQLFSTPKTGTWLIVSPEPLFQQENGACHTVALAGTMPWQSTSLSWSHKNRDEQHIVESTIAETLSPYCKNLFIEGPVSMRADKLVHLRTDLSFHLKDNTSLGKLLSHLHPTPAVCGFPQAEAKQFILQHETLQRRYFSGFAGPLNLFNQTHLFVSIRCAEIQSDCLIAYAGGGIMPESDCLSEWNESGAKMQTILSLCTAQNSMSTFSQL